MRIIPIFMTAALLFPGCAIFDRLKPVSKPVPVVKAATQPAAPVLGAGRTAAALDTSSAAEKTTALAAAADPRERSLGKVTVALGSPAEQGFWLRTTLVSAPGKGRVEIADGQSVAVDLVPGASGAQLSLAAFRALGLSLTALPEVGVFAR